MQVTVASGREDFGLRLVEFRRLANLGPLALVIREEPDVQSGMGRKSRVVQKR